MLESHVTPYHVQPSDVEAHLVDVFHVVPLVLVYSAISEVRSLAARVADVSGSILAAASTARSSTARDERTRDDEIMLERRVGRVGESGEGSLERLLVASKGLSKGGPPLPAPRS